MKYSADYSTRVSNCKKCKQQIPKKSLRLAKVTPSPFSDGDEMKNYFHMACMFDSLLRARATTQIIETVGDIEGYGTLEEEDKQSILDQVNQLADKKANGAKPASTPKKTKQTTLDASLTGVSTPKAEATPAKTAKTDAAKVDEAPKSEKPAAVSSAGKDDSLDALIELCDAVAQSSKYTHKTETIKRMINKPSYDGDVYLLLKLLLVANDHRVYNMKEKQLIKIFSTIFRADQKKMTDHFNNCGEISLTIEAFCPENTAAAKQVSSITLQYLDSWLDQLTELTREEDQEQHLRRIVAKVTPTQLKWVIRFIKKDLRINAGPKHILEALHADAHNVYQSSRNLRDVVDKVRSKGQQQPGSPRKQLSVSIKLGSPVQPMLAEACRSVGQAMKKCPNGMYAEIKYDGERVQVHKSGQQFTFYSRSLKPVQEYKVADVKSHVEAAFPGGDDLILDSEVLLVDTETGKPLPFGTLGKHKRNQHSNAQVCLFVFDCLMYNGQSLMDKPLCDRRKVLEEKMVEVKHRIMFSDYRVIKNGASAELQSMIDGAIDEGLEGLVLKDTRSIYEPGKRHWLKVKKDYLADGSMADTADLLVLGGYYGTGNKGGQMSVFLMGVHDPVKDCYLTVTKCGNGHDDATLLQIHDDCMKDMVKIGKSYDRLPPWLRCARSLVPDYIMKDPKQAAVWEVTGAEFSKSDNHTAGGISIRFPRVTRIRDDKNWKTATNLQELKKLFATSKQHSDFGSTSSSCVGTPKKRPPASKLDGDAKSDDDDDAPPTKKQAKPDVSPPVKPQPAKPDVSPKKRPPADAPSSAATDTKVPCKYGAGCYQKNPEHRRKFSHPTDTPAAAAAEPKNADRLFAGCKFYFASTTDSSDRQRKVRRYAAFAGGELLDEGQAAQATHAVRDDDDQQVDVAALGLPANVQLVNIDWVLDSIKAKRLLPTNK